MAGRITGSIFSSQRLLTQQDYNIFSQQQKAGNRISAVFASDAGRRYLGRLLLAALGVLLSPVAEVLAIAIQGARFRLSPFYWIQSMLKRNLRKKAIPLTPEQQAGVKAAAGVLHPDARPHVLAIEVLNLPRLSSGNFLGQYTLSGNVLLRLEEGKEVNPDLVRHEWAHYWWGHQMKHRQRRAFVRTVRRMAATIERPAPESPTGAAWSVIDAWANCEDAQGVYPSGTKFSLPMQKTEAYRMGELFGFFDLEVHAYIVQVTGAKMERIPEELREFYAGYLREHGDPA